jgi:hypothetical protein
MLTHLTFKKKYRKVFVDNWSLALFRTLRLRRRARKIARVLISTYTLIYYNHTYLKLQLSKNILFENQVRFA